MASSPLQFTSALPSSFQAGQSYTIEWSGGDTTAPVTLLLWQFSANGLATFETLTTAASGGSFLWNVPSDIVPATNYALEIIQATSNNSSNIFAITSGSGTTPETETTATTPATTSTSARIPTARPTDLTNFPDPSTLASAAATSSLDFSSITGSSSSTGSLPSPSGSPQSTPSQSGSALSTGDKAAIGIGVVLGVILIAGIAFWFGKYGSRWRRRGGPQVYHAQDAKGGTAVGATELATRDNTAELPTQRDPRPPAELA